LALSLSYKQQGTSSKCSKFLAACSLDSVPSGSASFSDLFILAASFISMMYL
jgi:hypothetical protein